MKATKIVLSCLLVLALAQSVFAQEVDLSRIVVTGARMEQEAGRYGGNVTVLGPKDIKASGAGNTAELIQSAGGVYLTRKSTAKTSVIDIRGFGDTADRNVLVLVNGRKRNSVDNTAPDFLAIPLGSIERVEIIRGAGSVLYGDNAVGGVVNIITKKGKGPAQYSIGGIVGSYDSRKVFVEAQGSKEKFSYVVSSSYDDNRGYRSNSDVLSKDFNARLGYEAADRLSFDFDLMWHEDHYGLPGGLNDAGLTEHGRRGSDEEENYGDTTDRTFGLLTTVKPWENPDIDGEFTVDYSFRNQDTYGWYDYGAFGATGTKRNIDTHALLTKYVHKGEVNGHAWNTVVGIDLYDVANDIWGSGTGISASTDDLTISKQEVGLYGYGELEFLPKIFAGTGIRYQQVDYTFDQRAGFAAPNYVEKDPSETVKKGLIRYEYSQGSNVYASVEETFRFLSTDEWYNTWSGLDTTLEHQTGIQYELGWKHDFDNKVEMAIVPYWIETDNEIFLDPAISPGNNKNYDEIVRQGVEVSNTLNIKKLMEVDYFKSLQLKSDYNFQNAEFQSGSYDGYEVPMAPKHQFGITLSAEWDNGFGVALSEQMVGSRYVINDTDNSMPKEDAYFLTNIKFSFKKKDWEMFAVINNIFGEKYNEYAARSTGGSSNIEYYAAPERNFEVGMKVKF